MATKSMRIFAVTVAAGVCLGVSVNVGHASVSGEGHALQAAPMDAAATLSRLQLGDRFVVATKRRGVKTIAGLPVRSAGPFDSVTAGDFWRRLGRPQARLRPYPEACVYRWRSGIELTFASFGGPLPCNERALQGAKITKRAWSVKVGRQTYGIGDRRRAFPRQMKHWPYLGYQLAWMPFIGRRSPTVGVVFGGRGRAAAFNLFIGGAGD